MANPIAYKARAMASNVDACTFTGLSEDTLYNGSLVTLGDLGITGAGADLGYVYTVTPTTANTAKDVWMVVAPAVPKSPAQNIYVDPRMFSLAPGAEADIVRPQAGTDMFTVSAAAFGENQLPTSDYPYVTAAANGQMIAVADTTATGIIFKYERAVTVPVGHENVSAYILKCIQNPVF